MTVSSHLLFLLHGSHCIGKNMIRDYMLLLAHTFKINFHFSVRGHVLEVWYATIFLLKYFVFFLYVSSCFEVMYIWSYNYARLKLESIVGGVCFHVITCYVKCLLYVCIRLMLKFVNGWVALQFFFYKLCYLLLHVFHIDVRG